MALGVPEKCPILFLGIPYKTVGQRILPMALEDSSLETTRNLALQLANAFQASGHEMFSPLNMCQMLLKQPKFCLQLQWFFAFMSCCMTQNAKTAFLLV